MSDLIREARSSGVKPVIGMVHLHPLPGSPRYGGDIDAVRSAALADARALADAGVHAIMIENFGDSPFFAGRAPAVTVSHMTALAAAVRDAVNLPLGINVLRNDALSALAIAHAVGAVMVRVNVLAGAAVTDQGVIEGPAAELLRDRAALRAEHIRILADVRVKHAAPLVDRPIEDEVDELVHRAGADGLILTGSGTGRPTDPGLLRRVRELAGDTPVFVGSGATERSVAELARHADGFIVGTGFKQNGRVDQPVDPARVRAFMAQLA